MDTVLIWVSIFLAYFFRFEGHIPNAYITQYIVFCVISTLVCIGGMLHFRLYKRIWRYASIGELVSILRAIAASSVCSFLITNLLIEDRVSYSLLFLSFQSMVIVLGVARLIRRIARDTYQKPHAKGINTLIIGAGDCGTTIAKQIKLSNESSLYPVAFIDDDPEKQSMQVLGIPVVGGRESIPATVKKYNVQEIIIAIPAAPKQAISDIISICKLTRSRLKILPNLNDLLNGRISIKEMRDVGVEDLLGREPIKTDLQGIASYVENRTVLVTGAGGSIGSELCKQLAIFRPGKLLLLGHGENSIYSIEMELKRSFPELVTEPIIADVQDRDRIQYIFKQYRPQVVFHAAAHKHVPLMENNPTEAIKNNVIGTKNVADCSDTYGAESFVLISTDKAVNPTSVMGTTKRIAEMYIQSLSSRSRTKFSAVRFGNVLGSRGSVIPRFKEQIARGGPVTVTHPDMIRYFMTIPEAAQLVIQAGALARGGDVFILDMGKPVKIVDLAKDLIRLSGFEPDVDIPIQYTGIRPGEKLYEELLTNEEGLAATKHNRIFIGKPSIVNREDLELELKRLERAIHEAPAEIRNLLRMVVPTYQNYQEETGSKAKTLVTMN